MHQAVFTQRPNVHVHGVQVYFQWYNVIYQCENNGDVAHTLVRSISMFMNSTQPVNVLSFRCPSLNAHPALIFVMRLYIRRTLFRASELFRYLQSLSSGFIPVSVKLNRPLAVSCRRLDRTPMVLFRSHQIYF